MPITKGSIGVLVGDSQLELRRPWEEGDDIVG